MRARIATAACLLSLVAYLASDARPRPAGTFLGEGRAAQRKIEGRLTFAGGALTFRFRYRAKSYEELPEIIWRGQVIGDEAVFKVDRRPSLGLSGSIAGLMRAREKSQKSPVEFRGPLRLIDGQIQVTLTGNDTLPIAGYRVRSLSFTGDADTDSPRWRAAREPASRAGEPRLEDWKYGHDPYRTPPGVDYRNALENPEANWGDAEAVRFALFGDWGRPSHEQALVARGLRTLQSRLKSQQRSLDGVLLAGDNFYPNGVTSLDDEKWERLWGVPFRPVGVPFLVAIGNHDYKVDPRRAQYQVAKTGRPGYELWRCRDDNGPGQPGIYTTEWFETDKLSVQVVLIDTNVLVYAPTRDIESWSRQLHWLWERLEDDPPTRSEPPRLIARLVVGHHLLASFGDKERETAYINSAENKLGPGRRSLLDIVRERASAYLCGHAHTVQYVDLDAASVKPKRGPIHGRTRGLEQPAPIELVSGTACDVRQTSSWSPSCYYTARLPGFTGVVLRAAARGVQLESHFVDCSKGGEPRVVYSLSSPLPN
jgi:hypothetical protein